MKRKLSLLLAIVLTLTLVTPVFAINANPKANTGTTNSEKVLVEKTLITINENEITVSRGETTFLPYQVSKTNPTITIKNVGGLICMQFEDATGELRLISLGKEENLVFNGRFPALIIDKSIKKMNVTFGTNTSIGKLTINGKAKVDIHGKMSVEELYVNGASIVNFAKDAKIGKAIVTSAKAIINVPPGASFKVIKAFAVRASTSNKSSGNHGNSGTVTSPIPENPNPNPDTSIVVKDEQKVSTQTALDELKKNTNTIYSLITITGSDNLDLSGITATKVTVEDPATKQVAASARREVEVTRKLKFPNTIDEIICNARANIISDDRLKKFTGNKEGIILDADVTELIVNNKLIFNRDVTTINASSDFAMGDLANAGTVEASAPIAISGGNVTEIITAYNLNLFSVNVGTVTANGNDRTIGGGGGGSSITNLNANGITTLAYTNHIATVIAQSNLTIARGAQNVETVIVAANNLTITANEPLKQIVTGQSLTIAGTAPVSNVTVTGSAAVTLKVTNTAEAPIIGKADGATVTAKDKEDKDLTVKDRYPAPKFASTVIDVPSNIDSVLLKSSSTLPDGSKLQWSENLSNQWNDCPESGYTASTRHVSSKQTNWYYFKTTTKTDGSGKADSQIVYVTLNIAANAKCKVTFDSMDGSEVSPAFVAKNSPIRDSDLPTTTKAGATFDGWYKEKECTNRWTRDDEVVNDMTLYAKWNDSDTTAPTASFDPIDGEKDVAVDKSISIFFDEATNLTAETVAAAVTLKQNGNVVLADVTLSADTKQIVIDPTSDLTANTEYTVAIVVDKIADAVGNKATGSAKFTTFNQKSTTPTAIEKNRTATKNAPTQTAVSFTLNNESEFAMSATWEVYAGDTGDTLATGVTADNVAEKLTLTHASNIPAGTYWVAVTEKDKTESDRLELKVLDRSRTPTADVTSVAKTTEQQQSVEFTLTNEPEFAAGAQWAVYRDAGIPPEGVTIGVKGKILTLTHASDVPARMFWVVVTEKGKGKSERLDLTVLAKPAGKAAEKPVADTPVDAPADVPVTEPETPAN